jgi:hypothetical protein
LVDANSLFPLFDYQHPALVDAIRLGNQREAGLAAERLSETLLKK